jgi:hypothetical protein
MRQLDVGLRFNQKTGLTFFGTDEVNALIKGGAVIVAIEPGDVMLEKVGEGGGNVQLVVSGFKLKVSVEEQPGKSPEA